METTRYDELRTLVAANFSETTQRLVDEALAYAAECLEKQVRYDGSPLLDHAAGVARIVISEIGLGRNSTLAAILHDVVRLAACGEPGDLMGVTSEIRRRFGDEVLGITVGLSNISKIRLKVSKEQAANFRDLIVSYSEDPRVILIKLADRLEVMRNLRMFPREKWRKKSWESMNLYAQIAHKLGLYSIKSELEDIALSYLEPAEYEHIHRKLEETERERQTFIDRFLAPIVERLDRQGFNYHVKSRTKSIFSIWTKMHKQHVPFEGVYDIFALRIILDCPPEEEKTQCWAVYSIVTDYYIPNTERLRDWISIPKSNGYESLHTTVSYDGYFFEVQIRTEEMHRIAEMGIAAHWKYKDGVLGKAKDDERISWVRKLLEVQQDANDEDFMKTFRIDLFADQCFVSTPKGDIIALPADANAIDFAYAIHSAVGNSMIGAKVNNRIASYDAPLHNGDIVEILTSKSAKGPSRDWLNICQSNQARVKIKQWFKREKREENIVRGKASFEAELRHAGVDPDILQNAEILPVILKKVSFECLDDMYAAIGYGGLTAAKAVGRIRDDLTKATRTLAPKPLARQGTPAVNSSGVIVEDIGSCMIKFSRCCTPVPGDEIIGFITKGYGVSVHRKDCPNARAALDPAQKGRWVKVTWAEAPDVMFSTSLEIEADDRDGLMLDVATILTSLRLRTSEMSARSVGGGTAIVCLRFGVHNLTELENVRTRLRGISGVHNVERGTE